jgi:hypothetical protein
MSTGNAVGRLRRVNESTASPRIDAHPTGHVIRAGLVHCWRPCGYRKLRLWPRGVVAGREDLSPEWPVPAGTESGLASTCPASPSSPFRSRPAWSGRNRLFVETDRLDVCRGRRHGAEQALRAGQRPHVDAQDGVSNDRTAVVVGNDKKHLRGGPCAPSDVWRIEQQTAGYACPDGA